MIDNIKINIIWTKSISKFDFWICLKLAVKKRKKFTKSDFFGFWNGQNIIDVANVGSRGGGKLSNKLIINQLISLILIFKDAYKINKGKHY